MTATVIALLSNETRLDWNESMLNLLENSHDLYAHLSIIDNTAAA
jgi:hypothetical protein